VSLLSRVLGLWSSDRKYRAEEQGWQSSGDFPDEFQRVYSTEHQFQKDEVRLKAMGYRPVHTEGVSQHNLKVSGTGTFIRTTYQRNPNPLSAPDKS
jgi:hypothetical protein